MLLNFLYMIVINSCGILIGSFLTEDSKFALPLLSRKFDRKPFNCKPCFTFHLLWIGYAIVAAMLQSASFFVIGFIFALAIFGLLYIEAKNKISK